MRIIFFLISILFPALCAAQGVGINKDGSSPDQSAMLDVKADSLGVLIPRTDTSSIPSPVNGLLIYDTTEMQFFYFKVDRWVQLVEKTSMRYYFRDEDGDGFGNSFDAMYAPDQLPGYVPDSSDCDDLNAMLYPTNTDLCDEIDNDCDPGSPDGSGESWYAQPCDGADADLCEEGQWECVDGTMVCSDNTGDNPELCDGVDNDCDPSTPDGSDEIWLGTPCDGPDTDLCEEGVWECVGGAKVCSDNTGDDVEICDGVDNDCDGQTDEGSLCPDYEACSEGVCSPCCSNNGGSSCAMSTVLGTICGDQGSDQLMQTGCGEAWFRFTLDECNSSNVDLMVNILLNVPTGMDYDLYLYQDDCSTLLGSSTTGGIGTNEHINYQIADNTFVYQATNLYVFVDLWSGNGSCSPWTLTITGN